MESPPADSPDVEMATDAQRENDGVANRAEVPGEEIADRKVAEMVLPLLRANPGVWNIVLREMGSSDNGGAGAGNALNGAGPSSSVPLATPNALNAEITPPNNSNTLNTPNTQNSPNQSGASNALNASDPLAADIPAHEPPPYTPHPQPGEASTAPPIPANPFQAMFEQIGPILGQLGGLIPGQIGQVGGVPGGFQIVPGPIVPGQTGPGQPVAIQVQGQPIQVPGQPGQVTGQILQTPVPGQPQARFEIRFNQQPNQQQQPEVSTPATPPANPTGTMGLTPGFLNRSPGRSSASPSPAQPATQQPSQTQQTQTQQHFQFRQLPGQPGMFTIVPAAPPSQPQSPTPSQPPAAPQQTRPTVPLQHAQAHVNAIAQNLRGQGVPEEEVQRVSADVWRSMGYQVIQTSNAPAPATDGAQGTGQSSVGQPATMEQGPTAQPAPSQQTAAAPPAATQQAAQPAQQGIDVPSLLRTVTGALATPQVASILSHVSPGLGDVVGGLARTLTGGTNGLGTGPGPANQNPPPGAQEPRVDEARDLDLD